MDQAMACIQKYKTSVAIRISQTQGMTMPHDPSYIHCTAREELQLTMQ